MIKDTSLVKGIIATILQIKKKNKKNNSSFKATTIFFVHIISIKQ